MYCITACDIITDKTISIFSSFSFFCSFFFHKIYICSSDKNKAIIIIVPCSSSTGEATLNTFSFGPHHYSCFDLRHRCCPNTDSAIKEMRLKIHQGGLLLYLTVKKCSPRAAKRQIMSAAHFLSLSKKKKKKTLSKQWVQAVVKPF